MRSITWPDDGQLAAFGAAPGLGAAGAMWEGGCLQGPRLSVPEQQGVIPRLVMCSEPQR